MNCCGIMCLCARLYKLTCVLFANLLTRLGGPLPAEVLDPLLRGRVGLIVQGQLGWVEPVGHIQEAAHAHDKATS